MTVSRRRLLVLSNMWPSEQKPYAGVFVKNQVEQYSRDVRIEVDFHCMKRSFTGSVGSASKYLFFFASFAVKHLFRRYDVLHVHYFFPTVILGVLYKLLHPSTLLVVTFHGGDVSFFIGKRRLKPLGKWLIRYVDIGIAVSKSMACRVKTALDFECQHVLSAGVRDDVFYPLQNAQKEFDFIFVGSFTKVKGVDLLVDALRQIATRPISLAFVGSGELCDQIRDLDGFHRVTLLENLTQNELRDAFSRSRFHVLPSRSEAFGLVVSEAMFCGVPVVGARVGGIPEQINDGINGWLIEPGEVGAISDTLIYALELPEDRYRAMVENCLKSNKENTLSAVCDEQLAIYSDMSASRKGRGS